MSQGSIIRSKRLARHQNTGSGDIGHAKHITYLTKKLGKPSLILVYLGQYQKRNMEYTPSSKQDDY